MLNLFSHSKYVTLSYVWQIGKVCVQMLNNSNWICVSFSRNTRDTSFGEEDSFGLPEDSFGLRDDSFGLRDDSSFGYQDDEQAAPSAQPKLNYHTFMKRTSKQSWSQQDTELFYEVRVTCIL